MWTFRQFRMYNARQEVKDLIEIFATVKSPFSEEEYIEYKDKIPLIFKSKNIKTAMNRFDKLNKKFDEMPEIIQNFMRKLSKKLEITLNHTKNRKIPSTNN